jgi:monoterpene epsilon-lactone hydrolase
MASPELAWAIAKIAADRAAAGVVAERYDVMAARASLTPSDLPLPDGLREIATSAPGVPCTWVVPANALAGRRLVYLHGGGFCAGGYHSHRSIAGWLAHATRAAVLFVSYRLAPEHRFPAALDDATAALHWAQENGPSERAAASALFIAGDSAGAALAIGAMLQARSAGRALPRAAALLCGMLDLDERTSIFLQQTQRTRDMTRQYIAWLADLENPLASPMRADLAGLPPLLVQTGTADYCRDDCERFAARAQAHGVATRVEVWPEMIHVWQRFAPKLPEALRALEQVAGFFEAHAAAARAAD